GRGAPRHAPHSQPYSGPGTRWQPLLLVLLDDSPEIVPHLRDLLARHLHFPGGTTLDDDVELRVARILFREVVTEVPAATFLSLERSTGHDLGYRQQVLQIEGGVPSRIVLSVSGDRNLPRPPTQPSQSFQGATNLLLPSHDSNLLLHHLLQIVLDLVWPFLPALSIERLERAPNNVVGLLCIDSRCRLSSRIFGCVFARSHAEHQQVGERIPAEPVCSVQPGTHFACRKKAWHRRHLRVAIYPHSTHHVVRSWYDFHRLLRNIDVGEVFELMIHARKLLFDVLFRVREPRANPGNVEEDAAVRTAPALAHLLHDRACDVIASQQLGRTTRVLVSLSVAPAFFLVVGRLIPVVLRDVVEHESPALAIHQYSALAANALRDENATHTRGP